VPRIGILIHLQPPTSQFRLFSKKRHDRDDSADDENHGGEGRDFHGQILPPSSSHPALATDSELRGLSVANLMPGGAPLRYSKNAGLTLVVVVGTWTFFIESNVYADCAELAFFVE